MLSYLLKYQTFANLVDLDEVLALHIKEHNAVLNETDRDAIRYIGRMACKFPGALTVKNETFASAIGKSVTTARRVIRKLEKLGVIRRVHMIRPKAKGYGANIIQVCQANYVDEQSDVDTRQVTLEPTPAKDSEPIPQVDTVSSLSKDHFSYDTYAAQPKPTFYQRVKSLLNNTIGNDRLASRIYGVIRANLIPITRFDKQKMESYERLAFNALKIAVQASKVKSIGNLVGYYNGILDKQLTCKHFEELEGITKGVADIE